MNQKTHKSPCRVIGCGQCDTTAQELLSHSPKPESEREKYGIHGEAGCPHCFNEACECECKVCRPKPENATTEPMEDEWDEFDNGVGLLIGKAGKSEGVVNVRKAIKAYITANYVSKDKIVEIINKNFREIDRNKRVSTALELHVDGYNTALSELRSTLFGKDQPL